MCTPGVLRFANAVLKESDVRGKSVLEVGSLDVNGTVRPIVQALHPASYIGVDLQAGPGVDVVCDATEILARFGTASFDAVISTELLEHVRDWRTVIRNFKLAVKPGGLLLLTTRSPGVDFHRHPFDFWRYDMADFTFMFSDFLIEELQPDPDDPGIFLKARRPAPFWERDLSGYPLYSILRRKRIPDVRLRDLLIFQVRYRMIRLLLDMLPRSMRRSVRERLLR